jgi:hypothetical protein
MLFLVGSERASTTEMDEDAREFVVVLPMMFVAINSRRLVVCFSTRNTNTKRDMPKTWPRRQDLLPCFNIHSSLMPQVWLRYRSVLYQPSVARELANHHRVIIMAVASGVEKKKWSDEAHLRVPLILNVQQRSHRSAPFQKLADRPFSGPRWCFGRPAGTR